MLSIWVGRAGSGKSDRVLRTMAQRRAERRQILLVPEHISHEAEVDLCRVLGPTASRDAEVLSFRNLATRVLSEAGGLADFTLDNGGKLLTMRLALQEVHSKLKVFGRPSQRAAFLQQLVELADEFYAYEIAPETLWQQVADLDDAMGDKLRDIALLYAAYDAKLHNEAFDARSRMQKLRDHLEESCYLDGADVYLDGFSYLNQLEESVLEIALRKAESVTVTLLGDRNDKELFRNAQRQRERLVRMARRCGQKCEILHLTDKGSDELAHLEMHFFGSDDAWVGEVEQIALYEAGTAYTECEWAAAQILQLVRSGACRFRDIGVASRNMDIYGPILDNAFARAGIPAYISRRSDLLEKPVITMLLGAVDAVTGGFEYEDMFRYLKTGLAGISEDDCDLLENYVVRWEIRGNMWLREKEWTAHPGGYGLDLNDRTREQLARINAVREAVAKPLRTLHEELKTSKSAKGKAEALYMFAQRSGVPQALEEKVNELLAAGEVQLAEETGQLWEILCGVLDQFVEILGESELSGEEFAKLLRLVLTQYSVGTIPATLDQVKVSEITRNDRHRVKYLFLLGANDHLLPALDSGRGLLDDADREMLQQREILLSDAGVDPLDQELEYIYACLAQPSQKLWVSWASTDLNGTQLRPSFVVNRMAKLFPALRVEREDGSYRTQVAASALELAGEEPDGRLWQYLACSGRYDTVLEAMRRARAMQRGRLSPDAVRTLYGHSIRMSASRMDTLKRCHFGYFMQYGLKAKERRAAGFEAPEIGTFIHYLLENVTRDVMEQGGYGAVEKDELRAMVRRYVNRYADECIDSYQEKSARFRYLFSRLRSAAWAMIENIADELANSDFRPMAFELGFGGGGELPAITIHENETTLSVSGKVDRVDGWIHEDKLYLRVVDYKTGKKSFDLTDLRYGLGIQMLLYLFTLADKGQSYFGREVVPAGVLYLPARDVILRAERNISPEKLSDAMRKELRRSGMVLSEPQVLQAMEHSALESPSYLPLRISKDGGISGGVATAAQLGKLGGYVDRLLHQIARELESGNIDADPCSRGPQDSACTYCEFASACYFEDGRGRDRTRHLRKTDEAEFWQFVDGAEGKEVPHGEHTAD
ncbi:MAG: ATP-dependent nuclease subunit B [Ruminococcaceae bacterium]|nr:ATP-dependent nuclease subunit B [Oscillospiraceae bacterium]